MNELVRRWEAVARTLETREESAVLDPLRSWIAEWDRRFWAADFSGFERIYAPDFVGTSRLPFAPADSVEGPQGFPAMREDVADVVSRFWFDIKGVVLGSEGRFAGVGRLRSRGRYTGIVLQTQWAIVWQVRDGMLIAATAYRGTRQALRDLEAAPTP